MKFWEKPISELNEREWEALCDGCGRCCLLKLECEDSGDIFYTDLACNLLDLETCQCSNYSKRFQHIEDCIDLKELTDKDWAYMPDTCAYRLRHEGKPLPQWHPLLSSDKKIHELGISILGKVTHNSEVPEEAFEEHLIHWVHY